jgi:uncharacterized protein
MKSALTSRSVLAIQPIRKILPLMLGVLSLTMIAPMKPALAEQQMIRTLTVSGMGTENVPTSITRVTLGVDVQGREASEVQQEAARKTTAVVELLRSRNVDRLQTTGVHLSPTYDYSDNTPRITGYTASNSISFQIPTERAGTIISDAVAAGASRVDGVSFIASDEAIAQARQVALREATDSALEQADAVLENLGLNRGEVVSIQINGASAPPPVFAQARSASPQIADIAVAPVPVIGGEQEVQASVTLQVSY